MKNPPRPAARPTSRKKRPLRPTPPGAAHNIPRWAATTVFPHTRTLAWEGTAAPLRTTALHPATGSFLDELSLVRRRGLIAWEESIHPLDQDRVRRQFASAQLPSRVEYRMIDRNGAVVWVRHTLIAAPGAARGHLRGFIRDIHAEKELELESLRVSEREQNRIGQDLHDDLCQVLAGVSCLMRVLQDRIAPKVPGEVPALAELNQQIVDAMHRTRALTHGLFPGKIQIADVRGALLELAAQVRARFQVEVTTRFSGRFPHHSPHHTIQIYRLAQEAMSNSIKHGRATRIDVVLSAAKKNMTLTLTDNGTGLGRSEPSEQGVGMHIMRYRTQTLGGELTVANGPDRGVVVSLRYPFTN